MDFYLNVHFACHSLVNIIRPHAAYQMYTTSYIAFVRINIMIISYWFFGIEIQFVPKHFFTWSRILSGTDTLKSHIT